MTPCSLRNCASQHSAAIVLSQTDEFSRQGLPSLSIMKLVSRPVKDLSGGGWASRLTSEPLRSQTWVILSMPKKRFCMTTHLQTLFLMKTSQMPQILARKLSWLVQRLQRMYLRYAGANFWNYTNSFQFIIFTTRVSLQALQKLELLLPPELSQLWQPYRLRTYKVESMPSLALRAWNSLWKYIENCISWFSRFFQSSLVSSLQTLLISEHRSQSLSKSLPKPILILISSLYFFSCKLSCSSSEFRQQASRETESSILAIGQQRMAPWQRRYL